MGSLSVSLRAAKQLTGSWLRTSLAGSVGVHSSRRSSDDASAAHASAADNMSRHTFDSPLQKSLHLLKELQSRLHGGSRALRAESRVVEQVIGLLHSPDLLDSKPMDELIRDGKIQSDDDLKNWLEAMEWVHKNKSDSRSDSHGSGHASMRASTSNARPSSRLSKLNSELLVDLDAVSSLQTVDEVHGGRSRLISAPVLRDLSTEAESRVAELLEHRMGDWEFDMLELSELTCGHPIQALGWAIFERHGLRSALSIRASAVQGFLRRVEDGYKAVPYHNAAHGACVAHGVHHLITQHRELAELFGSPIDILSVCLAALVHDLGHTGHNNAFHVASGSDLAILYSDQSVLEMHHLASAFKILQDKECDVLASLGDEARKEVRSRIVSMVLATDLAVNFPTINVFKQMTIDKTAELDRSLDAAAEAAAASDSAASTPTTQRTSSRASASSPRGSTVGSEAPPSPEKRVGFSRPSSPATDRDSSAGKQHSRSSRGSFRGSFRQSSRQSGRVSSSASGSNTSSSHREKDRTRRPTKLREQLAMRGAARWKAGDLAVTAAEEALILKMLIKVSDIGNVTKGREYCLKWTDRVVEEFFAQGDLEAKLKLPVTPFMDRKHACVAKQQMGFYNFIVKPMLEVSTPSPLPPPLSAPASLASHAATLPHSQALDGLISMDKPLRNLEIMQAHWAGQLPVAPPAQPAASQAATPITTPTQD